MLGNWRNWCRLCANQDAIFKLESTIELNQIVQRHFMVSVTQYGNSSTIICEECYNFINKLERFRDRCLQTDKMFAELILNNMNIIENDLSDVRFRYGLETELLSAVNIIDESSMNQQSIIQETTKLDQCVDTSDLDAFEDICDIKIEDEIAVDVKKKRGRPKRTDTKNDDINLVSPEKIDSIESHTAELDIILQEHTLDDLDEVTGIQQLEESHEEDDDCDYENIVDDTADTEEDEAPLKTRKPRKKKDKIKKKDDAEKKVTYKCSPCNKSFFHRQMYDHHIQAKHPDSMELKFVCSKCPKRFATEKKVKLHESVHLPDSLKMVHPCPYCDKRFSKQVNVQAHIKAIHIGERPFICEECGKSFGTKGALKEHQITHSDERPFQCSHCPKKFKNLPRLKTHEDIHNDTMYVCPHCGLQLNTKRTLKMHMVVHSDQKKYKCHYCGNEYKRSKALKNHLILHTGLRPYLCPFCDKTFANGSNCRSHKKKSHPMELAALEASGEQTRATNIPKLEHLQPKPHQIQSMQQMQAVAAPNAMTNNMQPTVNNSPMGNSMQQNIIKLENIHPNPTALHHQHELQNIAQIPQQLQQLQQQQDPQQQHLVTQQLHVSLTEIHTVVPTLQVITTNNS